MNAVPAVHGTWSGQDTLIHVAWHFLPDAWPQARVQSAERPHVLGASWL